MIRNKEQFDLINLRVGDRIDCHRMCRESDSRRAVFEKQIEIILFHENNTIVVERWDSGRHKRYYRWEPNFSVFGYEIV
jgi:hypothetical protein